MDNEIEKTLPPFDLETFRSAAEQNRWEIYDTDEDLVTATAARNEGIAQCLREAREARELQAALLNSTDQRLNEQRANQLEQTLDNVSGYVHQLINFFGFETGDWVTRLLQQEVGFTFTKEYTLTPESIEAPIYLQENKPMTAKTAKADKTAKTVIPDLKANDPAKETKEIPLDKIIVSPFDTQERRRARFTTEGIATLATDIGANSLIQAIAVRPTQVTKDGKKYHAYEIVAGERRFLAVKLLGRKTINATISTLSDQEAFDIQQSENREREPTHPVDQAYTYKFMSEHFGYDDAEIATREGVTPSYVASRKKLLELGPTPLAAFEDGKILLGHALEIAKHPAAFHQELLDSCFTGSGVNSTALISVRSFIARIETNFLHRLDQAPFPIDSPHLRTDGLVCGECTNRTGAHVALFAEYNPKDQCQDAKCWKEKISVFTQISRTRIAVPNYEPGQKLDKKQTQAVREVPRLTEKYFYHGQANPDHLIQLRTVDEVKSKSACDFVELGILEDGDRIGKTTYFCRHATCPKHAGKYRSSNSGNQKTTEQRQARKEEIIDVHVGEAVRKRVFEQASLAFSKELRISDQGFDFLPMLLAKLWDTSHGSPHGATLSRVVEPLFLEIAPDMVEKFRSTGYGYGQEQKAERFQELPHEILTRLIFALVHGNKGEMYFGDYKSQKLVTDLAEEFGVDYVLIDAEERLKYANAKLKKHLQHFLQYYEDVKAGKKSAKIPRVYFPAYEPKK